MKKLARALQRKEHTTQDVPAQEWNALNKGLLQGTNFNVNNVENVPPMTEREMPQILTATSLGKIASGTPRTPLSTVGLEKVKEPSKGKRSRQIRAQKGLAIPEPNVDPTTFTPMRRSRKPRPPRKKGQLEEDIQLMQLTPMPSTESPNDIGPPPPNSKTSSQRRVKKGRWTREQKGKGVLTKERKPRNWKATPIIPNQTGGVVTRAKAAELLEYNRQRENDNFIQEVLSHFQEEHDEVVTNTVAPESLHTIGSMDTRNINLWDTIFREDAWMSMEAIEKAPGFESTHPGGTISREKSVHVLVGEMPTHLYNMYKDWSMARAGWAVLVPNRFLSEASIHTGDTPMWTQGHVIGEGVERSTGKKKVVCELGFPFEYHMDECNVRIALTPSSGAMGSEGGRGYGWAKRQEASLQRKQVAFNTSLETELIFEAHGLGSMNGDGDGKRNNELDGSMAPGLTEHVADNNGHLKIALEPPGEPIADYDMPLDVEGVEGTQDSTARTTFPKVSFSLPGYMGGTNIRSDNYGEEDVECGSAHADSSDLEWIPTYEDTVVSSDSDFDVDIVNETLDDDAHLAQWCMRPEAFTPVDMDEDELSHYYRESSWNSVSVDFVRTRDNFSGPTPGLKCPQVRGVPQPDRVFNMYWSNETLDRIVIETNRYARTMLPCKPHEQPRTKGGPTWVDVDRAEIQGWIGVCILMGCKKLPSIRHYWMKSEKLMYCELIAQVMTLARFEQILRCLHLVDNNNIVRDVASPEFDRVAKTRWLLDMFDRVSQEIYNLEREITVDECVIPYKGRYCFIRQFMPDKPIRFGIKVWLLASSKSRFVWRMEVYFGEGTGSGPHGLGYHVVGRMTSGLEYRGHHLVVDNLFASVKLFHKLMVQGMWATGTVRHSSKNLPKGLYRELHNEVRGSMLICMHDHRQIGVVSWQDKKLVTLLSTALPPWMPGMTVLRYIPGLRGQLIIPSSPMHKAYVEYMRGVDVTDHLRSNYSAQSRCHKWWMKLFHFVVDQSMVNTYVTWVKEMEDLGLRIMPHLAFKIAVGKCLVQEAVITRQRRACPPKRAPRRPPRTHAHFCSKLRRSCVVCGRLQRWYCEACGYKWMCQEACYYAYHEKST